MKYISKDKIKNRLLGYPIGYRDYNNKMIKNGDVIRYYYNESSIKNIYNDKYYTLRISFDPKRNLYVANRIDVEDTNNISNIELLFNMKDKILQNIMIDKTIRYDEDQTFILELEDSDYMRYLDNFISNRLISTANLDTQPLDKDIYIDKSIYQFLKKSPDKENVITKIYNHINDIKSRFLEITSVNETRYIQVLSYLIKINHNKDDTITAIDIQT